MKKRIFFISCEEAQHICDKSQYAEATLWEKVKLNIRLSWCKITRAYTKNNRKLTKAIQTSNIECLKQNERKELNDHFQHELENQNQ